MQITEEKKTNYTILYLDGRLDTINYNILEKHLSKVVESGEKSILVNCSKVQYVSSSGLRVLLMTLKKIKAVNGKFVLCCLADKIKEVFDIAGFSKIFDICDNEEDAIEIFE